MPSDNRWIYCSGPLFSPEERAGMGALAIVLEAAGFGTFLPQRDGLERFIIGRVNSALNSGALGVRGWFNRAIFALDVYQIVERCDAVVVNLNGRVPDEGAAVEAGIAFTAGRPVILYKNDERSAFNGADNAMLLGLSSDAPASDPDAVVRNVKARLEKAATDRPALSSETARIAEKGRRIWALLEKLPKKIRMEDLLQKLLEELSALT